MKPDKHAPWLPAPCELAVTSSIQALAAGTADNHQQQRALKWIIEIAAGTYEPSYRGGSESEVAFLEGRRYVGLQIVRELKLVVPNLRRNDVQTKA